MVKILGLWCVHICLMILVIKIFLILRIIFLAVKEVIRLLWISFGINVNMDRTCLYMYLCLILSNRFKRFMRLVDSLLLHILLQRFIKTMRCWKSYWIREWMVLKLIVIIIRQNRMYIMKILPKNIIYWLLVEVTFMGRKSQVFKWVSMV